MANINEKTREIWVEKKLASVPRGRLILDLGAGECQYKKFCPHLTYVSQDVAIYDGEGNQAGLQTGTWDFSQIDIRCDAVDIPEDVQYDAILCTEVLEHVPDPVRVVEKIARLVKPGGDVLLTAPFSSLTHFAPYHYATGFSSYFYSHHLDRLGLEILEITPNGGYFDFLDQELGRAASVHEEYVGVRPSFIARKIIKLARKVMRKAAAKDGERERRNSAQLLTMGWQIHARMRA
ncbi:class I SAM-dependent methyltransferase [Aminobacter anthyllidis]|uniref:Class I SAM-dependent methyltransferase n=1 Tax=Aminobacter anthyllidis TaxID=1035067 RepID=A0A9X1D4N4_9HYPH|nr:class I SAM-dependent methyltransferase [Aminobacter anthyllidis]MBT1155086.1 class I SAM-dependent methyltransferase [Aminobacter anthyllidis]MDH4985555.1 class I SAM-dependent methyltransferase [Aminobacter anthyllidis]